MAFVHVQDSDDSDSADDADEHHEEEQEEEEDEEQEEPSEQQSVAAVSFAQRAGGAEHSSTAPKETAAVLAKRFQQLLRAGRHSSGSRFQLAVHAGRMSDGAQRPAPFARELGPNLTPAPFAIQATGSSCSASSARSAAGQLNATASRATSTTSRRATTGSSLTTRAPPPPPLSGRCGSSRRCSPSS